MTAATLTLTDFLLARIAEDETSARAATPGPWAWQPPSEHDWTVGDESLVTAYVPEGEEYPETVLFGWGYDASCIEASDEDRAHIARHHPARVLAECEAKRRIVDEGGSTCSAYGDPLNAEVAASLKMPEWLHYPDLNWTGHCDGCSSAESADREHRRIMQHLATIYADHPDYRDEWTPRE